VTSVTSIEPGGGLLLTAISQIDAGASTCLKKTGYDYHYRQITDNSIKYSNLKKWDYC